ncbi:MAG TPA: ABC transporter ATP-binding protein [Streptosporangiaceae bacterium]|nr:ABC transporter ATP-binding protein [Streptosporangiaceae bacterium]
MSVINCEHLTKQFGKTVAVNDIDLDVSAGQVYGFLGPNGAGKTTTIRMLLGLISPTAGQIRLLGRRLPDPKAVRETGSMIEEPAFYPWLTGEQNLRVAGWTGGGCSGSELTRVLAATGLGDDAGRKVRTYSQGMRQRLGLAAAMLGRPPLLIIDEPTNSLDPAGIREIRGLLGELAADGTAVFLSSHLLAEVEQVCDRAAVIVKGRVVEEGPPAELGATRRRVRLQVDPADKGQALQLLGRWSTVQQDGQILVEHGSGKDVNTALAAGGVIAGSVTVEQPRLEDRFLEIVGEDTHVVGARG